MCSTTLVDVMLITICGFHSRQSCFIDTSVASSRFVNPTLIAGLIRAASGFRLLMKHALSEAVLELRYRRIRVLASAAKQKKHPTLMLNLFMPPSAFLQKQRAV